MARIVFITNSIGFGGAEKMVTYVANQLAKRSHACAIVNLGDVPDYVNAHMQSIDQAVTVYHVTSKQHGLRRRIEQIGKIKSFAKCFGAEVIVGFTSFPNLYASVVGKLLRIPSVMSERGDPCRTMGKSIKDRVVIYIINRASGGVFQTDGAKAFYGKGLQKRGIVIPNPIFIKGEIPQVQAAQREKTVVSVGRLDNQQKRLDVMLNAFRIFAQAHPAYVLKLYGRGDEEEQIRQWSIDLGIGDKVKLMGLTTQPMQDIARDGMFLITSDYEGISNALLEAMAAGLPCVSTDHTPGGARLLIQDRENGLLAPIGDAEALAKAMCAFAEDPALAEKCGQNARDVINRFDPKKIIDMWESYILRICHVCTPVCPAEEFCGPQE